MTAQPFPLPPQTLNSRGDLRRVGFEFEYAGLGLSNSVEILHQLFGGEKKQINRFHYEVRGTRFGDFSLESDSALLKNRKYESQLRSWGLDVNQGEWGPRIEGFIETFTQDFVPFEIVTPPIPIDQLSTMEELRLGLHKAGAKGTYSHVFAAYGLQFNPEMPALDAATLLNYMRAFFLLYDRLRASISVPLSRRVLPYIDPFPVSYIERVLSPAYAPDMETLMRDYLLQNPTRNRPLDWLPLFAHIDRELVMSYPVERDLIKPRPTLHYRLPSCLIDDPAWTISSEWEKWLEVERLANNPLMLERACREWVQIHGPFDLRADSRWLKRTGEFVHELGHDS